MISGFDNALLNRFKLEKELKTSERSKISLVRDKETRKRHICLQFSGSGEVYRKIQGIDCPYLPKIEEVIEQNSQVLVLEEYIQGDTLAYLLEEQPLCEELVRPIAIQICRALEILHSIGVVHRDIKPENVILRGDEAVLIDFDASRVCKPERVTDTQVMGTTGYAAPEQYGFAQTDARADIYAFGILLNEMLTRQHPARALAQGSLSPIIEKCIEVNMDKRYSSATELLTALEHSTQCAKRSSRNLRLLPLLLSVTAILIAVACLFASNGKQTLEKPDNDSSNKLSDIVVQENVERWTGDSSPYTTVFQYDLDKDGKSEEYLFGAAIYLGDDNIQMSNERLTMPERKGFVNNRYVFPAVWKQSGEGTYELMEEFSALLENPEVTLWCVVGDGQPEVWDGTEMKGIWNGGIRVTYRQEGTWLYACSATLNGQKLSATAITATYFS